MITNRHIEQKSRSIFMLLFLMFVSNLSAESFRVVSYNVENYFDYEHDSLSNDSAYLPDGERHWNFNRYAAKQHSVSKVIINLYEQEYPLLVGLCEIENDRCLSDLLRFGMPNSPYRYAHFESPDERGIDVALLYDAKRFHLLSACPINVSAEIIGKPTRDILYVSGQLPTGDTLHVFVCHTPSQLNKETIAMQNYVFSLVQQTIDSIVSLVPSAKIIVMGDMNGSPKDNLRGMHNLMVSIADYSKGSYKHEGIWEWLDQFYVSSSLLPNCHVDNFSPDWLLEDDKAYLGKKPKRTFIGFRYNGGVSDHLPIVLDINDL